jgi:hypothetical protein
MFYLSTFSFVYSELEAEHEDALRKIMEDAQIRFQVLALFSTLLIIHHFIYENLLQQSARRPAAAGTSGRS